MIYTVLRCGLPGEVYNIGGKNEETNLDIVRLIQKRLGKSEALITHVKDCPGHDRRYAIDSSKIRTQLGWRPQWCFEDAICDTIDWYLKNQEWIEHLTNGRYMSYYREMYGNALM